MPRRGGGTFPLGRKAPLRPAPRAFPRRRRPRASGRRPETASAVIPPRRAFSRRRSRPLRIDPENRILRGFFFFPGTDPARISARKKTRPHGRGNWVDLNSKISDIPTGLSPSIIIIVPYIWYIVNKTNTPHKIIFRPGPEYTPARRRNLPSGPANSGSFRSPGISAAALPAVPGGMGKVSPPPHPFAAPSVRRADPPAAVPGPLRPRNLSRLFL